MIHKRINILAGTALITLLFTVACSDVLDEQPRSIYEPGYFKTEKGIQGGLTALYSHLRDIYGQGYHLNAAETGTDEYTWGRNANSNFKDIDLSGAGTLSSSTSRSDVVWNATFRYINTASGIIENATEAGIPDALTAEARFFRAFDYFLLVQTFGGVPLDLGSGELKFNTTPARTSVRNTVPEVYTKAIFPDLLTAINDLPASGRVTGGVTQTAARLHLAKAYLTYAWWLENPNNIPTYPEATRTDPDGHDAAWYYQQAYNVATAAIDNPGPFGLQPTFYDVNVAQNDRNSEIVLYADRTESSEFYNGASLSYDTGGAPSNFAQWMVQWQYELIQSSKKADWSDPVTSVKREAAQDYGRPWTSMAPPIEVFTETFADKTNDSRYDGTFTTVYRGNWQKGGVTETVLYGANALEVRPDDAILTFLDEEPATDIDYSNTVYKSGVGAGVLPGRADFVVSPRGISRHIYPGLWKLGPYRTDNGSGLGQPNGGITRPFPIAKFSELYLIAAEAAIKGATATGGKSARELVNVLRARAGKWSFDHAGNVPKEADHSAAMTAATPQTITIDYILEERSREFFGEGYRWYDLVRTQTWDTKAATFEICGTAVGDHTPVVVTRDIQKYHYLRPIPQGQLDGMEMTEAEKAAYQNPGYTVD
ncbi:MAG: RagB/SusD family nutrient uptake outer membrane protein [Tannerellaceae bacterium]|jgi:hypothetical protein|nr:RagB/SusD family nutrient uptake outer membrane protein [Tannerellaceae bacterium]